MNLDEEIFELREKGLSYRKIAEELANQGKNRLFYCKIKM